MKTYILVGLIVISSIPTAWSQDSLNEARRRMLMGSSDLLAEAMSQVSGKSLAELKSIVRDNTASPAVRSASAQIILRKSEKQDDKTAALHALGIRLPLGVSDTESDWTKNYPAAAEASLHPDLMPQIVQRTLSGELPEPVVGFVLLRYQSGQNNPQGHLAELLKSNMQPYQRQRCERLIALLKGETLATTVNVGANQPAETAPTTTQKPPPIVQTSAPKKAPEAKPSSTPSEEPTSSTPWSIIVVLIVSALGLLWLVLKRRS
jgi:hypothetical protein